MTMAAFRAAACVSELPRRPGYAQNAVELVTPTGAAIITAVCEDVVNAAVKTRAGRYGRANGYKSSQRLRVLIVTSGVETRRRLWM